MGIVAWTREHWDEVAGWKYAVLGFFTIVGAAYVALDGARASNDQGYAIIMGALIIVGGLLMASGGVMLVASHLHRRLRQRPQ